MLTVSGAAEALLIVQQYRGRGEDPGNGQAAYLALKAKYASHSRAALMDVTPRFQGVRETAPNKNQRNICLVSQELLTILNSSTREYLKTGLGIVLGELMATYALVHTFILSQPIPTTESVCQMIRDHWRQELAPEVHRIWIHTYCGINHKWPKPRATRNSRVLHLQEIRRSEERLPRQETVRQWAQRKVDAVV